MRNHIANLCCKGFISAICEPLKSSLLYFSLSSYHFPILLPLHKFCSHHSAWPHHIYLSNFPLSVLVPWRISPAYTRPILGHSSTIYISSEVSTTTPLQSSIFPIHPYYLFKVSNSIPPPSSATCTHILRRTRGSYSRLLSQLSVFFLTSFDNSRALNLVWQILPSWRSRLSQYLLPVCINGMFRSTGRTKKLYCIPTLVAPSYSGLFISLFIHISSPFNELFATLFPIPYFLLFFSHHLPNSEQFLFLRESYGASNKRFSYLLKLLPDNYLSWQSFSHFYGIYFSRRREERVNCVHHLSCSLAPLPHECLKHSSDVVQLCTFNFDSEVVYGQPNSTSGYDNGNVPPAREVAVPIDDPDCSSRNNPYAVPFTRIPGFLTEDLAAAQGLNASSIVLAIGSGAQRWI